MEHEIAEGGRVHGRAQLVPTALDEGEEPGVAVLAQLLDGDVAVRIGVELAQAFHHLDVEAEGGADRRSRLPGPAQGAAHHVVHRLVGEPAGEKLGLAPALLGERRVGGPLGALDPLGQTVADQEQLHAADRSLRP